MTFDDDFWRALEDEVNRLIGGDDQMRMRPNGFDAGMKWAAVAPPAWPKAIAEHADKIGAGPQSPRTRIIANDPGCGPGTIFCKLIGIEGKAKVRAFWNAIDGSQPDDIEYVDGFSCGVALWYRRTHATKV